MPSVHQHWRVALHHHTFGRKRLPEIGLGGATAERGGRSKRYFEVTQAGKKALAEVKTLRDELWSRSKINLSVAK